MTDVREKLVELLRSVPRQEEVSIGRGCGKSFVRLGIIADHLIANGVTIQRWIPVEERLPEPFEVVLVYDKSDKCVSEAYMTRHKEWVGIRMKSDVSHWMPLPEPPKEEE